MSKEGVKLFQPNNHSEPDPKWVPVTPEQEAHVREALALFHPGAQVAAIQKPSNRLEFSSRNYLVGLSGDIAGDRRRVLKEHTKFPRELDSLTILHAITTHLFAKGHPVTLPLSEPKKLDANYWEEFPFVEGTGFRGTKVELENIARAFARLHNSLGTYPHPEHFLAKDQVEQHLTTWTKHKFDTDVFAFAEKEYAETLAKNGGNLDEAKKNIPWSVAIHDTRALLDGMIQEVIHNQDVLATAPQQATHGDLHPHEVIMNSDGTLATFTTLGKLSMGPLAEDIGMFVHRFAREYAIKEKERTGLEWTETVPGAVRTMLDTYQTQNALFPDEIATMMLHATNRQLEKLYTRGKDNTPNGQPRKPGDSRAIQKWLDLAQELPVMQEFVLAYLKEKTPRT